MCHCSVAYVCLRLGDGVEATCTPLALVRSPTRAGQGKYGCGRVYGPGTEPAPYVYSGPTNPKKDTRDFELKKLDGQIICTDPRCTALRKVKKGKKFVDRPNDTPLTACEGCGGKYGCGAKYNAQTCPKPTDKDGNIDEERGSIKCTSPACRKLRFCRPARTGRNPRPEQKPNDSALYKNTLRSLTKMECPNCHVRWPRPKFSRAFDDDAINAGAPLGAVPGRPDGRRQEGPRL